MDRVGRLCGFQPTPLVKRPVHRGVTGIARESFERVIQVGRGMTTEARRQLLDLGKSTWRQLRQAAKLLPPELQRPGSTPEDSGRLTALDPAPTQPRLPTWVWAARSDPEYPQ